MNSGNLGQLWRKTVINQTSRSFFLYPIFLSPVAVAGPLPSIASSGLFEYERQDKGLEGEGEARHRRTEIRN